MAYGTADREASRANSVHPNYIHSQTLPLVARPMAQVARRLGYTNHYANSYFDLLENIVSLSLGGLQPQRPAEK
tara:strand:- start:358 stop:579 length:222 start_codon:yes stop_codon:yes gene_type:complete